MESVCILCPSVVPGHEWALQEGDVVATSPPWGQHFPALDEDVVSWGRSKVSCQLDPPPVGNVVFPRLRDTQVS